MSAHLPPEIWEEVFRDLNRSDWSQLRQVCRVFGTIGAKPLFSSIRVYLLDDTAFDYLREDLDLMFKDEETVREQANRLSVRSWEVLDHITRNPDFAVLVRTLLVCPLYNSPSVFEHLCLMNAIRKLPSLTTFHWWGSVPFPGIVAQSLPDNLTSLWFHEVPENDDFAHLRNLRKMVVKVAWNDKCHVIQNLIANNTQSLRGLSLPPILYTKLPVRLFGNLTDLHIENNENTGFGFALRHVTAIESLSLRLGHEKIDTIHLLLDNSDTFTNLVSLRLSVERPVSDGQRAGLLSFIRERRKLRRLYLDSEAINIGPEVYSLIRALPDLQVLGLVPCHPAYRRNYPPDYLHHFLPRKLKGFHATLSSRALREESENLLDEFERFEGLTYFSLRDGKSSLLDPAAFAADKPALRFIRRNNQLFDVRVDRFKPIRWPSWKSTKTIPDDFDDEDEWWLHDAIYEYSVSI